MSTRIVVPRPRSIFRSQVSYIRPHTPPSNIKAPQPAKIDRAKLVYESKIKIPQLAKVDRSRVNYIRPQTILRKTQTPKPARIDRSKLVYESESKSGLPKPAKIDRDRLVYELAGRIPKARKIKREHVHYLTPELTVLENNVHSPETPGTENFAPFAVSADLEEKANNRIAQYPADQKRSAVLPLLHEVQHRFGFISPESIDWVAQKLDIAPIKVVEVVTFYPGFRQKAPGKLHFRVCRTLSCAMGGSYELMARLCEVTGIDRSSADGHKDPISVSPCGKYSVEYAECLASCGTAPVCLVNDDFHEGVAADKVEDLIAQYNG